MAPPLGSLIVGPCPRCNEMVLLFNGSVMPLDKDIISDGTAEEKKQHLLEAIVDMVALKVGELVDSEGLGLEQAEKPAKKNRRAGKRKITPSVKKKKAPPISHEDVRDFVDIDLHLIDSKDYFEKIFGKKTEG
jgi:hypothetical protein